MKARRWMAAAMAACLLALTGCQSFPAVPLVPINAPVHLVLAVPQEQPDLLNEVSRELARRTENFAQNSMSVEILPVKDIWDVIAKGEADLVLCENDRLAPHCSQLQELEYPYYFKNSGYLISAANDGDVLDLLNYHLKKETPMKLRRIAYSGTMNFVTNDIDTVRDWRSNGTNLIGAMRDVVISDEMQSLWNVFFRERKEPLDSIWKGKTQIAEVDLTRDIGEIQDEVIIMSAHRAKMVDIFVHEERLSYLDQKQKAALDEAIIYAAGYCKTLADDARKKVEEQIQQQKIEVVSLDQSWWYDYVQSTYLSKSNELDKDLLRLIRKKGIDSD